MAVIKSFKDLEIWNMARQQCREIFEIFSNGDPSQDFALKNQLNAAAGSVMDNIAEGFERSGTREFIHFLVIAKGSNGEVRSQLARAAYRTYINVVKKELLFENNRKLSIKIAALIKYLKSTERKGFRYD